MELLDRSGEAVFAAVLRAYPLRATISASASYCDRWHDSEPATDHGTFHLIDSGVCWVRSPVLAEPLRLEAGDLVMFAHGAAHVMCSAPDGRGRAEDPRYSTMLCGEFEFAHPRRNPLLDALPACFVVREQDSAMQFRRLAQLMSQESGSGFFAARVVLDKLAEALFVMALRHYLEHARARRGLIAALLDPRLARVLAAIHTQPGRDWTVAALAELAHLSRTAFAQHFSQVLGSGPIEYLTGLRMDEAVRLLADPRRSVAACAEELGYRTEAAFRRAFKRVHGFGPGRLRRRAALAAAEAQAQTASGRP
jgi:AraC family transcriptional activator of mtrCDE